MSEKPTLKTYCETELSTLGFHADLSKSERSYQINVSSALTNVSTGNLFKDIVDFLYALDAIYADGNKGLLYSRIEAVRDLRLVAKPFGSVLSKIHRKNVVNNRGFPRPPREGFVTHSDFYVRIDDLIRTRIVCKYMDGPKFVCEQLKIWGDGRGLQCYYRDVSTEAGYYGWHFISVSTSTYLLLERSQLLSLLQ